MAKGHSSANKMENTTITVSSQHNRNITEMRGKLIQQLRKDLIDKVYTRGDEDKEREDHIIQRLQCNATSGQLFILRAICTIMMVQNYSKNKLKTNRKFTHFNVAFFNNMSPWSQSFYTSLSFVFNNHPLIHHL